MYSTAHNRSPNFPQAILNFPGISLNPVKYDFWFGSVQPISDLLENHSQQGQ